MEKKPIGDWHPDQVRALREKLGLTQCKAAARIGITGAMWCRLERGSTTVTGGMRILLTILNDGILDAYVSLPYDPD